MNLFDSSLCAFGKLSMRFLRDFWFIPDADLSARHAPANPGNAGHQACMVDSLAPKRKRAAWPLVVAFLYVYTSLKIVLYLVLQFRYDEEYLRLCQMDHQEGRIFRVPHGRGTFNLSGPEYAAQKSRVVAARQALKLVGAPLAELHLFCVCCAGLLISVTFSTYGGFLLLTKLKLIEPLDLYLVRVVLNQEAELERCRRDARSVVERAKVSIRNSLLCWIAHGTKEARKKGGQGGSLCDSGELRRAPVGKQTLRELELHTYLWRLADIMLERGQLLPMNRSAEWVDWTAITFSKMSLSIMANFFLGDHFFICVVSYFTGYLEFESFMDVWMYVDILLLVNLSYVSTAFFLGLTGATYQSQRWYLQALSGRFRTCIENNAKIYAGYCASGNPLTGSMHLSRLVNRNLMVCLLELEIYSKQFGPTRRTFPFLVNVITTTVTGFYVMFRLSMPYFAPWVDSLALYFGLVSVVTADIVLVPVCQIHQLGLRLHKTMCSLTAQTVEMNARLGADGRVFSAHLYSIQQRLGADVSCFTNRFAAYGYWGAFKVSWLGLVKWHLVFSLLPLSAFFQANSWKMLAGNRINDPLGIFVY